MADLTREQKLIAEIRYIVLFPNNTGRVSYRHLRRVLAAYDADEDTAYVAWCLEHRESVPQTDAEVQALLDETLD